MIVKEKIKNIYRRCINRTDLLSRVICKVINRYSKNKVIVEGNANRIEIHGWFARSSITIKGNHNLVVIGGNLSDSKILIEGSNAQITTGDGCNIFESSFAAIDDGSSISIGKNVGIQHNTRFVSMEGHRIILGDNCMISYDIEFRNSDSHSILVTDESGKKIRSNQALDVIIGNNVWISQQALILKGTALGDGCIVGARSLVHKKSFGNNELIVGGPAKSVATNIEWLLERI